MQIKLFVTVVWISCPRLNIKLVLIKFLEKVICVAFQIYMISKKPHLRSVDAFYDSSSRAIFKSQHLSGVTKEVSASQFAFACVISQSYKSESDILVYKVITVHVGSRGMLTGNQQVGDEQIVICTTCLSILTAASLHLCLHSDLESLLDDLCNYACRMSLNYYDVPSYICINIFDINFTYQHCCFSQPSCLGKHLSSNCANLQSSYLYQNTEYDAHYSIRVS